MRVPYCCCVVIHNDLDVEVGYEQTSYTISELNNSVEICVQSTSPGISAEYDIIVQTQHVTSELKLQSMIVSSQTKHLQIQHTFHKALQVCISL